MMRRHCVVAGHRLNLLHRRAARTGILLIHANSSCKEVFSKQLKELARGEMMRIEHTTSGRSTTGYTTSLSFASPYGPTSSDTRSIR